MKPNESVTAAAIMSSPVRSIGPTATIEAARQLLLRYGHTALCVVGTGSTDVQSDRTLVGVIARRDIETAFRHGLGHSPVSSLMSHDIQSVEPSTPIAQIEQKLITYGIGRVPVVESGQVVGIVTRSDLLRSRVFTGLDEATQQISTAAPDNPSSFHLPSEALLKQQLEVRLAHAWPVLMQMADVATEGSWSLYIVGGAVRDLLVGLPAQGLVLNALAQEEQFLENSGVLALKDIDLVVAGQGDSAGVSFAKAVQKRYPKAALQLYGQFQTASLTWKDALGEPLIIDVATARTEFYAYPAANPEVEASSLHQDLYRRDFTINAMAIRLSDGTSACRDYSRGGRCGQLIDFFGGWQDLQNRQLKVLHNNSFIEDPTRIFRAIRFATRLDFELAPETVRLAESAIASGIYEQVRTDYEKVPSLQSRLTAELRKMLSEPTWQASLTVCKQIGALGCIHPDIELTSSLSQQLARMDRWLERLRSKSFIDRFGLRKPSDEPARWLILLEVIIANLAAPMRASVAAQLNLGLRSERRLQNLEAQETHLIQQIPTLEKPSQLYSLLSKYDQAELLLIANRHPYTTAPLIWQYIVQLSNLPSLITGRDLKQMGYAPGPQFRSIIADVDNLALDGKLSSPEDAKAYVLARYPAVSIQPRDSLDSQGLEQRGVDQQNLT